MTEQEERERLTKKANDDIAYLIKESEQVRGLIRLHFDNSKKIEEIDSVFHIIETIEPTLFSTGTIEQFRSFYTNIINRFKMAIKGFLINPHIDNARNELLESAKAFNTYAQILVEAQENRSDLSTNEQEILENLSKEHLEEILQKDKQTEEYFQPQLEQIKATSIDPKKIFGLSKQDQLLQNIDKRLKVLEQDQKPLNELQIKADQERKEYSKKFDELKKSIDDLQSSETQIEITKILTQTKTLFDEAKNSKQLVNNEVQKLIKATEREVAYTLSEQFEKKTASLKRPIWINFTLIFILILVLSFQGMKYVELMLDPKITNEAYWHSLVMVLLIKLPLIFLILFVLNEYTKAKKLFEEYEHKRIMAATLVNNLERLKNELHADEKDLLELIKVPFEKIFDNPVHSIYGDKSGSKNIGLDDLDKITSILEKLKPKTP